MMIKYRVHEVAKDLGLPNKEVIDTLQKYTGETKKHMTALTENELDVVFEEFTQKNRVESFDAYFADQKEPAVTVTAEHRNSPRRPPARHSRSRTGIRRLRRKRPSRMEAHRDSKAMRRAVLP